jgi:hypothetical protein
MCFLYHFGCVKISYGHSVFLNRGWNIRTETCREYEKVKIFHDNLCVWTKYSNKFRKKKQKLKLKHTIDHCIKRVFQIKSADLIISVLYTIYRLFVLPVVFWKAANFWHRCHMKLGLYFTSKKQWRTEGGGLGVQTPSPPEYQITAVSRTPD